MNFDFIKGQWVGFLGEMAVTVMFILFILLVERYANRTDTKKVEEKKTLYEEGSKGEKTFFGNDEMFKRTTT